MLTWFREKTKVITAVVETGNVYSIDPSKYIGWGYYKNCQHTTDLTYISSSFTCSIQYNIKRQNSTILC